MLGYQQVLTNFSFKIIQGIFFDHSRIKLEINLKKKNKQQSGNLQYFEINLFTSKYPGVKKKSQWNLENILK